MAIDAIDPHLYSPKLTFSQAFSRFKKANPTISSKIKAIHNNLRILQNKAPSFEKYYAIYILLHPDIVAEKSPVIKNPLIPSLVDFFLGQNFFQWPQALFMYKLLLRLETCENSTAEEEVEKSESLLSLGLTEKQIGENLRKLSEMCSEGVSEKFRRDLSQIWGREISFGEWIREADSELLPGETFDSFCTLFPNVHSENTYGPHSEMIPLIPGINHSVSVDTFDEDKDMMLLMKAEVILHQKFSKMQSLSLIEETFLIDLFEPKRISDGRYRETLMDFCTSYLKPTELQVLVKIAAKFLVCVLKNVHLSDQSLFEKCVSDFVDLPRSTANLKFFRELNGEVRLSKHSVVRFIMGNIKHCEEAKKGLSFVKEFCLLLGDFVEEKSYFCSELCIELQAFCICFSNVKEAVSLLKSLKQLADET